MANQDLFQNLSEHFWVQKRRLLVFPEGPGGFRELREAGRNHFHLSWYLIVPGVTSHNKIYKKNKQNLRQTKENRVSSK